MNDSKVTKIKFILIKIETLRLQDLTTIEKLILSSILSLSINEPCYATNGYLADLWSLTADRISRVVSSLCNKGYVSGTINKKEYFSRRLTPVLVKIPMPVGENTNAPLVKTPKGCGQEHHEAIGENAIHDIKDYKKEYIKNDINLAKASTSQSKFINAFSGLYQQESNEPYKANSKDFILVAGLLKKYGDDVVINKARILFELCRGRSAWFSKNGMADFTIGNLSRNWNSLMEGVGNGRKIGLNEREIANLAEQLGK